MSCYDENRSARSYRIEERIAAYRDLDAELEAMPDEPTEKERAVSMEIIQDAIRRLKTRDEYDELKSAGLTDQQIHMLRNTGASHAAILMYAKQTAWRK